MRRLATLPVLMYHAVPKVVPPAASGCDLTIPLSMVRRQWTSLRDNGWILRGLTEAMVLARADPAARVVGVTFDDGYADFPEVVDLLADLEARATLYLPTGHIGGPGRLIETAGRLLTWDEVLTLPEDRVEIGSHAHVHRPLDVLGRRDLSLEVCRSRDELRHRLGRDVVSFCYPNGYSSGRVRQAVAAAGYRNACTVGRRIADPNGDPFRVPRLQALPHHDERGILRLVTSGEGGIAPSVKRLLHPAWRTVRLATFRTSGRMLT